MANHHHPPMMNPVRRSLLLVVLALASLWFGVSTGSTDIDSARLVTILVGQSTGASDLVIMEIRLPRVLSAFAVGGLLALSGVLLQALLRNPLADPYVLGISGGASVGALLALILGLGMTATHGSAFFGAMLSMILVFSLGRVNRGGDTLGLLLTGVIIAAGWGAVISLLLVTSPDTNIQGMLFWLMGDLGGARMFAPAGIALLIGMILAWLLARPLNLLVQGDFVVAALGSDPARLRLAVYLLASVLTGTAVSLGGNIGFVGLVTPHLLRLSGSTDHRQLVPHSVLLGGGLLVTSDTLARTIIAPQQLPVGVITAFIGVPVFLFLLLKGRRA